VLGVKLLGIFPGNSAIGKDSHQGVVVLLDPSTGEPRAIVNATAITAVRTAAVSAVATDALAHPDASTLAVIGTGFQAQWHVRAIAEVRALTSVRMTGRDTARGTEVASALADETGLDISYVADAASALDGAQIVVTATNSATPVLAHGWLAAGAHVNAVGACLPHMRELDTVTVAASRFTVDRRESALAESGDYLIAAAEAGLGPDHIAAELGEVLAGSVAGRTGDATLTVFESLGLAVQDLAAAAYVCAKSEGAGRGSLVEF
jgi:ornithine cyclodeaminase